MCNGSVAPILSEMDAVKRSIAYLYHALPTGSILISSLSDESADNVEAFSQLTGVLLFSLLFSFFLSFLLSYFLFFSFYFKCLVRLVHQSLIPLFSYHLYYLPQIGDNDDSLRIHQETAH